MSLCIWEWDCDGRLAGLLCGKSELKFLVAAWRWESENSAKEGTSQAPPPLSPVPSRRRGFYAAVRRMRPAGVRGGVCVGIDCGFGVRWLWNADSKQPMGKVESSETASFLEDRRSHAVFARERARMNESIVDGFRPPPHSSATLRVLAAKAGTSSPLRSLLPWDL